MHSTRWAENVQVDPRTRAAASWRLAVLEEQTPTEFLSFDERVARLEARMRRLERLVADAE